MIAILGLFANKKRFIKLKTIEKLTKYIEYEILLVKVINLVKGLNRPKLFNSEKYGKSNIKEILAMTS